MATSAAAPDLQETEKTPRPLRSRIVDLALLERGSVKPTQGELLFEPDESPSGWRVPAPDLIGCYFVG